MMVEFTVANVSGLIAAVIYIGMPSSPREMCRSRSKYG
jgi:hypothetical protein